MSITDRLNECTVRIGYMCRDARPPRMSIPVREDYDDDTFITRTCLQAVEEIERLTAERGTLQKTMDEQRDLYVKHVIRVTKERNALNFENARLTAAMNRYSSDEVLLTKESAITHLIAERDKAQSQAAKARLYQADVIRLTAERDALKQDAERLDWLEAHKRPAEIYVDGVLHGCNNYGIAATTNHTLRVAIDAAMETTK